MVKLKPLANRLVIKRSTAKTTKGGILLPDTAQEKPKEGQVIACGPGKMNDDGKLEPMCVKIGDVVLFSSYAGTEFQDENEDYLILTEDEVLCVKSA